MKKWVIGVLVLLAALCVFGVFLNTFFPTTEPTPTIEPTETASRVVLDVGALVGLNAVQVREIVDARFGENEEYFDDDRTYSWQIEGYNIGFDFDPETKELVSPLSIVGFFGQEHSIEEAMMLFGLSENSSAYVIEIVSYTPPRETPGLPMFSIRLSPSP